VAVVKDIRMLTWLWYCTAEWSHGCGTDVQNVHVAVVPDGRMVTWQL